MNRLDVIANAIHDLLEAFVICLFIAAVLVWAAKLMGKL